VVRTHALVAGSLVTLGAAGLVSACTSPSSIETNPVTTTDPSCTSEKSGADCGAGPSDASGSSSGQSSGVAASATDGVKNGTETDVDCGGPSAPKCREGKSCLVDGDCEVACSYAKKCVSAPSCKTHLGGDTCGLGEVGPGAQHESCCRSLPVRGFVDPAHPGKKVYLDKYEITAGRVRAWIEQLAKENGGNPDVRSWIAKHRPTIWDDAWNEFLPTDWEGPVIVIQRRLLGDPRPEDNNEQGPPGPGVTLPPATDQPRRLGVNYQFGAEIYGYLHGNSCGTFDGSWGYPTYWYPADVLKRSGELPRADGIGYAGETIAAKDLLDVKSMNCITNAMLAAFCAWDGGQLATDEVLDYVTATPASLGSVSGCGTQYDNHAELLGNIFTNTVQSGGRCAPVTLVNATFDGGDTLPVPGSILNIHNYHYPDTGAQTHDKAWEISAPGRASLAPEANGQQADVVRIDPGDEPWLDLHGNLNEAALDVSGGAFTGGFTLKYRGIAYGTSRSDLNMLPIKYESVVRLQRPEVKAAFIGGRCMRFK
jgi:hypothetical protein